MNNLSGRLGLESEKRSMTHHNCLTLRNRSPKKRISNEGREQSAGCCGCRFVDFASCDGLLPNGKHRSRTDSHPFAKSERKTESKHGVRPDKDCSRSRLPFSEPESRPAPLGEPVAIQTEENVLAAELINHLLIRSAPPSPSFAIASTEQFQRGSEKAPQLCVPQPTNQVAGAVSAAASSTGCARDHALNDCEVLGRFRIIRGSFASLHLDQFR
jgi:hypothetical protein